MAGNDQIDVLRQVPLFSGLSKNELQAFLKEAQEEFFHPGEVIVEQDATGGRFYIIVQGRAKVIVNDTPRSSIGPGSFFGEMGVIDSAPRSATVKAETDVHALSIASWSFLSYLEKHWDVAHKIMIELVRKVRGLDQQLGD